MTVMSTPLPEQRSRNPLRPNRLHDVIGQAPAKRLIEAAIRSCFQRRHPLPHTLIVGASGTGKSTFSHVIANELGVDVYEVEAPVSYDTLAELRHQMRDGAILKIEEIHQQAIMERRGRSAATQPEVLYALMEDRVLQSPAGPQPFPWITVIGTTTDEGMLPDAFINRFPLRPRLVAYTPQDMATIIRWNARVMHVNITDGAVTVFSHACRGTPREANNLVRNAALLTAPGSTCGEYDALEVLSTLGITRDGLTPDMQAMLRFLARSPRRMARTGEVRYQASVSTIATAIGKSRDSKAIALRVEPYLIEQGFVQVAHGGRILTDHGLERALAL